MDSSTEVSQPPLNMATDFTVVNKKITQRTRHNGIYFFAQALLQQNHLALQEFRSTVITRPPGTLALLFHLRNPRFANLLGHPCKEAHLTFDEQFRTGDAMLAPGHYRGVFRYGAKTLKVGVYFDVKGVKISTTVSILDNTQKTVLTAEDPLFIQIDKKITAHYLPFQTLFSTLMTMKTQEIERLNPEITLQDIQLSRRMDQGDFDAHSRTQLISDIETFIVNVEKINSYNDVVQDVRHIQYANLLAVISNPTDTPPTLTRPTNTTTQPAFSLETQIVMPIAIQPVKDKITTDLDEIRTKVDAILGDLTESGMSDAPKSAQFIHVMAKLEQLELECWGVLFYANTSEQRFITAQKERLGFVAMSLAVYFATALESGDQTAAKTLLPHLTQYKKYSHFETLFKHIENTTLPTVTTLCMMARFLYAEDQDFRTYFHLKQMMLDGYKISETPIYQSLLMTLFLKNNLEGFRLLLENNDTLHEPQFIIADQQFSILQACIYYHEEPHATQFVRELFEHGMQVSHTINHISDVSLQKIEFESNKSHRPTKKLNKLGISCHEEKQDSLSFAIRNGISNLELIRTIAEHASLDLLLINLSQCLLATDFGLRVDNTSRPIVGLMPTAADRDIVLRDYAFEKDSVSIACLFYQVEYKENPEIEGKCNIIQILLEKFQQVSSVTSDIEKRTLVEKFVAQARQDQANAEKLKQALIHTHAGLFIWTQIADPTIGDYKLVLQLLYLRGMICSKVYRSNSDQIALITFTVAITLVMNLADDISHELQQTPFFKMLNTSANACETRLKERHEAGLFTSNETAKAMKPVELKTSVLPHKGKK